MRHFQLWDYSPSHRTLLFRSPAAGTDELNVDVKFTGVQQLSVPTRMTFDPATLESSPQTGPDGRPVVFFLGESGAFVLAETCKVESNLKELFDGLKDASAGLRAGDVHLELAVAGALGDLADDWVSAPPPQGIDFAFRRLNELILVQAKRAVEGSQDRIVRRLTMQVVDSGIANALEKGKLLYVLGGQSADVAEALAASLRTALGKDDVVVVAWEPGLPVESLVSGVERLLKRSLSRFEIRETLSGNFMFNLKAANGQIILTSEHYVSKAACLQGVAAVRRVSSTADLTDLAI